MDEPTVEVTDETLDEWLKKGIETIGAQRREIERLTAEAEALQVERRIKNNLIAALADIGIDADELLDSAADRQEIDLDKLNHLAATADKGQSE